MRAHVPRRQDTLDLTAIGEALEARPADLGGHGLSPSATW